MKELKRPWSHWHTAANGIPRDSISDVFNTDPVFARLDGAEELEGTVRTGVSRWTAARVEQDLTNGTLTRLPTYFRQVQWCTSVNLVSSGEVFDSIASATFDLPTTFFYDADAIEFLVGEIDAAADILPGDRLTADAALYRAAVSAAAITVRDDDTPPHEVDGDTHFAFLVPERAEEDQAVLRELVTTGVLDPLLALCLTLVDFPNPVFSPARAALLSYVPDSSGAGNGGQALTETFTSAIQAADAPSGSPEAEFLRWWTAPDLLTAAADALAAYHGAAQSAQHLRRHLRHPPSGDVTPESARRQAHAVRIPRHPADRRRATATCHASRRHARHQEHQHGRGRAVRHYSPPGDVADLTDAQRDLWSEELSRSFTSGVNAAKSKAPGLPSAWFYNPITHDDPPPAATRDIRWIAFPKIVRAEAANDRAAWSRADNDRETQSEYCEWETLRDPREANKVIRVTLTSETAGLLRVPRGQRPANPARPVPHPGVCAGAARRPGRRRSIQPPQPVELAAIGRRARHRHAYGPVQQRPGRGDHPRRCGLLAACQRHRRHHQ